MVNYQNLKSIAESKLFRTITLNYDGKSKPQTENYKTDFEDLLKKYYYNSSSNLDSMEFMLKDSMNNYQLYGKLKYYYNSLNQLIKTEQYNNKGILMITTEYKYDENVNISEVRFYDSKGLKEITTKTYDNKKNPWHELKDWLNYDVAVSKNNVQSISSTYYNGQENSETKHTYTYDSDGYPITKKIEYITNSIDTTLNETYEYQSIE